MFSAAAWAPAVPYRGPVACPPMDSDKPLFPAASRRHEVLCIGTALVDLLVHASMESVAALGLNAGAMTLIDDAEAVAIRESLGVERLVSGRGPSANTAAGLRRPPRRPPELPRRRRSRRARRALRPRPRGGRSAGGPRVRHRRGGRDRGASHHVIVTPDQERTMATSLGVSGSLHARFVADSHAIADAAFAYFDGYLLDFPDAAALTETILSEAAAEGTRVAFGLADPFAVGRHREKMLALVGRVDLLFANEEEALALSGAADLAAALSFLADERRVSVVTRGAEGAVVVTPTATVEVPAVAVPEVRDVTGAGDLFAAGVLYGAARGDGAARAAALGATLAAEAISHLGARPEADLAALVASAGLA